MKGYMIASLYIFGNILLSYMLLSIIPIHNIILYNWLGVILLSNISKAIYIYNMNNVDMGIFYLINKNKSIWTLDNKLNYILPWNFMMCILSEYTANVDREYIFYINNIVTLFNESIYKIITILFLLLVSFNMIIYNIYIGFIIFILGIQLSSFICFIKDCLPDLKMINLYIPLAFIHSLICIESIINIRPNRFSLYIVAIMILQLFEILLYGIRYYYQYYSPSSMNQKTDDFKFSNRKFFYINAMWVLVPFYIIFHQI